MSSSTAAQSRPPLRPVELGPAGVAVERQPPSLDIGEMTDKGSINQRAALAHRATIAEELYAAPPPPRVIVAVVKQAVEAS